MSSNSRRRVRRGPKAVSSLAGDAKSSDAFGRTSTEPRLHSTGKIGSTHQLNLECLRKDAKRADRVTVVSGYYVRRVLKKLVGECRGNVRVILNGLGGRRLEAQRKELTELQESLQRRNKRNQDQAGLFQRHLPYEALFVRDESPTQDSRPGRLRQRNSGGAQRPQRGDLAATRSCPTFSRGVRKICMETRQEA